MRLHLDPALPRFSFAAALRSLLCSALTRSSRALRSHRHRTRRAKNTKGKMRTKQLAQGSAGQQHQHSTGNRSNGKTPGALINKNRCFSVFHGTDAYILPAPICTTAAHHPSYLQRKLSVTDHLRHSRLAISCGIGWSATLVSRTSV